MASVIEVLDGIRDQGKALFCSFVSLICHIKELPIIIIIFYWITFIESQNLGLHLLLMFRPVFVKLKGDEWFLIMFRAFFVIFGHPISHSKYATFIFFFLNPSLFNTFHLCLHDWKRFFLMINPLHSKLFY